MKASLLKTLFAVFLLTAASSSYAQLENNTLKFDLKMKDQDSNALLFSLNTLNYLRNTEYFGPIEAGKTLFGYHLNPRISYFPNSNLRIDFGGFFRKDFGNDKFNLISPVFSIKYSKKGYSAVFGNYESAMNHRLVEPLFNIEYAITKPLENGFQFKIDKKRIFSDTWVDWQKMIYTGSPFKEEIMAGSSNYFRVNSTEKNLGTYLIYQALVRHVGGQIDALRTTPLVTYVNMAGGMQFSYLFNPENFIQEIKSENYMIHYSENSSRSNIAYSSGSGYYLNFALKTKIIQVLCSYWNARNYMSFDGTPIYQSANTVDIGRGNERVPKRELLFVRFLYEKNLTKDLKLDVRLEPFYEFNRKKVDHCFSVYLRYNLNTRLLKIAD